MNKLLLQIIFISYASIGFTQIPEEGLQLNYPFNNNANDLSVNNLHGLINEASITDDRFGNSSSAFLFDGENAYINVPNDIAIKPEFPFSISLWLSIDSLTDDSAIIYASDETNGIYSGYWIGYISSGEISAGYGDGLGQGYNHRITKHSDIDLELHKWYNIIVLYNDLNDIQLFINCHEVPGYYSGSGNGMLNLESNGAIGRSLGHHENAYHRGKIDDVRIYNKSLSDIEIDALCNEPNPVRVGTDDVFSNSIIEVFPNPSNGVININTTLRSSVHVFELYDLWGKRILVKKICSSNTTINLTTLEKGIYILNVLDNKNEIIGHNKVLLY